MSQSLSATKRPPMIAASLRALVISAGLAAAGMAAAPAIAQQPPAGMQVNRQLAPVLNAAQQAITAQNWAEANTQLTKATPLAKTPQEIFQVQRMRALVAQGTNDIPGQIAAIQAMTNSGAATPEQVNDFKLLVAQLTVQSGDKAKGLGMMEVILQETNATHDKWYGLAQQYFAAGENAKAEATAAKAIQVAGGGKSAPENYYQMALRVAEKEQSAPKRLAALQGLIANYPKDSYWGALITSAQQAPGWQGASKELRLDLFRTLAATGVKLTPDQKGQMAGEAIQRVLPGEALAILQPAFDSGELGGASDTNAARNKGFLAEAKSKAALEKGSLDKEAADVLKNGSASDLAALGEVFYTYGDYAKAAEFIQKGLDKGIPAGATQDAARLHLGMAQLKAGQKDAAKATFAQITSDNGSANFAKAWTLIADKTT